MSMIKLIHPEHPPGKDMSTSFDFIPQVGNLVEYAPRKWARVKAVHWRLINPEYSNKFITHEAVVELEPYPVEDLELSQGHF